MRERELATLLIQMGVDSGMDIEGSADALAMVAFPSFVDSRSFKAALLEAIETQMRAQMEERLQAMRKRFDVADTSGWAAAAMVQPTQAAPRPTGGQPERATPTDSPQRGAPTDVGMLDTIVGDMPDDTEGTSDDTIVWSPRRD
jgi:hypothetical protein